MKDPIENVTEFILRNSHHMPSNARIQLYQDTAELIPNSAARANIHRIIATLREADRACRQFSFMDHSDQI